MNKNILENLYIKRRKSVPEIAKKTRCSEHKVNYWLAKYKIPKRTISEAIYIKYNPKGDPFRFLPPANLEESWLFGLGLGLYWGEGTKADKNAVRISNSNAVLLKIFIKFLIKFFCIKKDDLKFQLHIFTDIDIKEAEDYWIKELKIKRTQLYKPVIIKSGSMGTYKHKSKYGVMTIHYGNTKLRNKLVDMLPR